MFENLSDYQKQRLTVTLCVGLITALTSLGAMLMEWADRMAAKKTAAANGNGNEDATETETSVMERIQAVASATGSALYAPASHLFHAAIVNASQSQQQVEHYESQPQVEYYESQPQVVYYESQPQVVYYDLQPQVVYHDPVAPEMCALAANALTQLYSAAAPQIMDSMSPPPGNWGGGSEMVEEKQVEGMGRGGSMDMEGGGDDGGATGEKEEEKNKEELDLEGCIDTSGGDGGGGVTREKEEEEMDLEGGMDTSGGKEAKGRY